MVVSLRRAGRPRSVLNSAGWFFWLWEEQANGHLEPVKVVALAASREDVLLGLAVQLGCLNELHASGFIIKIPCTACCNNFVLNTHEPGKVLAQAFSHRPVDGLKLGEGTNTSDHPIFSPACFDQDLDDLVYAIGDEEGDGVMWLELISGVAADGVVQPEGLFLRWKIRLG